MNDRLSRRRLLAVTAGSGAIAIAGCLDQLTSNDARAVAEDSANNPPEEKLLPVRDHDVPMAHDLTTFEANAVSGGVSKDAIPSIDDPVFDDVAYGDSILDPGDPVFGLELDGEARAYPQRILVRHEIVNDTFGDDAIAITYCPLTGTAVGFERGSVEFGVSGQLVNNNLIMYDRATDSWWPQILGASVLGAHTGDALFEERLVWTTWERWTDAYPETAVLTEETGQAFDYGREVYGSYDPPSGHYANDNIPFSLLSEDDRYHPKAVFLGARGPDGAVAYNKERLRDERLLEVDVNGTPHLATYDEALDTAWVYRNPESLPEENTSVEVREDGYERPDGQLYEADNLPLPSLNVFDAMWFAWVGFYPETVVA